MASPDPILNLRAVHKSYPRGGANDGVKVLSNIDLTVARGESLAIVGPSGSGKSTLLNIIGALDQPTSGQVELEGERLNELDDRQLARVRSGKIGFIFQAHHLLPQCSVVENVLLPTLAAERPGRSGAEQRANELLDRVGLKDRMTHRPGELSGGECQRVAVVRALINQPILLLADEPTGALDQASAQTLAQLLIELNREKQVTLILVTHALDLARRMARVKELRDGQFVEGQRASS